LTFTFVFFFGKIDLGKGGEEGVKHCLGVQKVPNLYVTSIHQKEFFDGEGFKCQTNARIHIHHFVVVGFNSPLGDFFGQEHKCET
jgi:hypothetical protein